MLRQEPGLGRGLLAEELGWVVGKAGLLPARHAPWVRVSVIFGHGERTLITALRTAQALRAGVARASTSGRRGDLMGRQIGLLSQSMALVHTVSVQLTPP